MSLFEDLLASRGITGKARDAFLNPSYDDKHDPFLLPDMDKAVKRLTLALKKQQNITIYGDYDIDGLTATTLLLDAFEKFGFKNVDAFIPNRFVEGYGLTKDAIGRIADAGAELIITVDCGSLSREEIELANKRGVDVIVTDHHNVAELQPPAVAVINPKRLLADYPDDYEQYLIKDDSKNVGKIYPFLDLAGVGVAFKLVQALQTELDGLPEGHEKWLLDLVALGTVCDVVSLVDENRANVFWGLKVLQKAHRPGLRALMAVSGAEPEKVTARTLGFVLGPRMNAAGRLDTARYALDMLTTQDGQTALELAQQLDALNSERRATQDKIMQQALVQAEEHRDDNVLVVSSPGWSHGIIGIVAAKLLERFSKPTFVLEEMGEESKGSARSYGDFSAADAIRSADDLIIKGGGHKLAAGITLSTANIDAFRRRVNEFYTEQGITNQARHLQATADADAMFGSVTEEFIDQIATLEPFGNGNPEPILRTSSLTVVNQRKMGADNQHVKLELRDEDGQIMQLLAFGAPKHFFVEPGEIITAWYQPGVNEWQGRRTIEGRLLRVEAEV